MPILPLDHPEPFSATLGVMLYPDEPDAPKARAFAAQYLAEPIRRLHEAGGTLPYDVLARILMDASSRPDFLGADSRAANFGGTYAD